MRDWLILPSSPFAMRSAPAPGMPDIVSAVAGEFGVPVEQIIGVSRRRIYARPRQVVYWLALLDGCRTTGVIAAHLKRDHTSVIHGRQTMERLIAAGNGVGLRALKLARNLRLPTGASAAVNELSPVKHEGAA